MLSRVLLDGADPDSIPDKNIATLTALGVEALQRRWQALFSDS
jgi:hypothetical protein